MEKKLKLGIPKGSLEKATIELFEKSGWRINVHHRSYFPEIDDEEIECAICRAQEMSRYVEQGILDCGITGKDWILENDSKVHYVTELVYSKVSKRPARWVLAVPADSNIQKLEDLEGKKIATELVNFTKRYFSERGINVQVEFSWGATEAKVVQGLADAIVEVTETGTTIKAHGLKIIHELMQSTPHLIANEKSWADPWKRKKIEQLAVMLKGALRAHRLVGLKMNVAKENLEKIVSILPSLNAPTISPLYESDWFAIETVVAEDVVRELVPKLLEGGAQGIIEYALNKVI
ncbi:ATP phosphoribosyltransferase [Thermodesulfatator atlanticus]|uniref:ATP phosphoribosyltransferase n=1 Tax=Thermodesulfatator atlanticus TaxID=501497 RepID=UPI0003B435CB|nr:ATP phosphoribosyltransferase [Thermodesulfatator atlanticus]